MRRSYELMKLFQGKKEKKKKTSWHSLGLLEGLIPASTFWCKVRWEQDLYWFQVIL